MADEYSRSPLGFSFIHRTVPVKTYRVGVPAYSKDLEWTTEPPTLVGDFWYWVRSNSGAIFMCFDNGLEHHPDATHWLGPLPVPEMP